MKILLDLQGAQTESRFRGIGRQAKALARALIESGGDHDFHLLLNRRLDHGLEEVLSDFARLVPSSNLHIFGVPGAVAERDSANLWRTNAAEIAREGVIAAINPDILHISSLFEGYVDDAVLSVGRLDVAHKTAVTLHDVIPVMDPERYLGESAVKRHWLRKAQFLKRADMLLAVSEYSKIAVDQWLQIDQRRVRVIGAGVDHSFKPASGIDASMLKRYGLDQPFLLYVGAVDPRKNVELILDAYAVLPEHIRQSRIIAFVGRLFEEEEGRLRIAAAKRGISRDRLRFCRHVSEDDLIALYGACDAFIFPSLLEGYGLPIAEAMACGAPVLAANATSLPEVMKNAEFLFDPRDSGDLARRLLKILTDDGFRASARAWGLARAGELRWSDVAARSIAAFEEIGGESAREPSRPPRRRLKMAFFSPLPGDKSGIADYSAELLPELARFYDIECIVRPETVVTDEWIKASFPIRDFDFFRRNSDDYDRIVYSIGNSQFHAEMLELQRQYPGVVILHDFFLSDLVDWMSHHGSGYDYFVRELYRSHGIPALVFERDFGRVRAVAEYPCSGLVFETAKGVLAHSEYIRDGALRYYGEVAAGKIAVVPHLRAKAHDLDRAAARRRLGVGEEDFLICSFGVLTPRKLSHQVLEAWIGSRTSKRAGATLVFVGEGAVPDYVQSLRSEAEASGLDIRITGFADHKLYRDYLAAADLAVQLRAETRGETSGTVLDCLAAGVPVIVNRHGPVTELPKDVVYMLDETVDPGDLARSIDELAGAPEMRLKRVERAAAYLEATHHPALIGERFFELIERAERKAPESLQQLLIREAAEISAPVKPDLDDLRRLSQVLAEESRRPTQRCLFYDVTVLAESDAKTGIQRVVRAILQQLIDASPEGYRIEPVRIDGRQLKYARGFLADKLGLPSLVCGDEPIKFDRGDIYLAMDWVPDRLPDTLSFMSDMRRAGVRIVIGVHDLLPFHLPQHFPDFMPEVMRRWFETALRIADQFVCVSASVADDVARFGAALHQGMQSISVDYIHNAADIAASLPSRGRPESADEMVEAMNKRPTFIMVGTVEPRKGHAQVLSAFDRLWRAGVDVGLVIVGKSGWMVEVLGNRLEQHPEKDGRLIWLNGISDEYLEEIYSSASALIAASEGEGFGLPLIEAARHGIPLIARDIPVFREVAGEHAFYFSGTGAADLADAITEWLELSEQDRAPQTRSMPFKTWRETSSDLLKRIFDNNHYRMINNAESAQGV
ncbi:glycosyltransferase [Sphingomonas montanisoli]|uniref:Glycosyltransferase n=1 Tax=Sphingomonas montanisoli TaxID=2606412 RepID=A0A5D9C9X1_9SPHN|nr:glycosyltransferase [Sphingomonas montanisoli]TZG27952.1 glycosyltransferase [Sphingomonas montanisoli]